MSILLVQPRGELKMRIVSATGRSITFVGEAELSALLLHPLRHAHHLPQHALRVGAAPHPGLQEASHRCCCILTKHKSPSEEAGINNRIILCIFSATHSVLHCTEVDQVAF